MNVRELIEHLGTLDPNAVVVTTDCCYGPDFLTPDGIEAKVMRTYNEASSFGIHPPLPTLTRVADIVNEEFDLDPDDYPDVRKVNAVVLH